MGLEFDSGEFGYMIERLTIFSAGIGQVVAVLVVISERQPLALPQSRHRLLDAVAEAGPCFGERLLKGYSAFHAWNCIRRFFVGAG